MIPQAFKSLAWWWALAVVLQVCSLSAFRTLVVVLAAAVVVGVVDGVTG